MSLTFSLTVESCISAGLIPRFFIGRVWLKSPRLCYSSFCRHPLYVQIKFIDQSEMIMKRYLFLFSILVLIVVISHPVAMAQGLPLGGIGTGKVEILPNGGFGAFTLHQKPHEPFMNDGSTFAAVYVNQKGNPLVKKLTANDPQGLDSVLFEGVFPNERIVYEDDLLPVTVVLEAFSPLLIRDAEKSAVPGAVLRYTVNNHSAEELEVALALSWQNIIGGVMANTQTKFEAGKVRHDAFSSGDEHGVEMRFEPKDEDFIGGDITLLCVEEDDDNVSIIPSWDASSNDMWIRFAAEGTWGDPKEKRIEKTVTEASRPAGALAVKRKLAANRSTTFTFVVAWHSPSWISSRGERYTARYADEWDSSKDTARKLADDFAEIRGEMNAWVKRLHAGELPEPMKAAVMDGFKELIRKSVWLEDGKFSLTTDDAEWQGNLGSPEERLAAMPFLLHCFPNLLRSELNMMMGQQLVSGEAPSYIGRAGDRVGVLDVDGAFLGRPDSTIAYVLLLYQYYLWTGDQDYLQTIYPHIRSALGWLINEDESGDGVPDGESFIGGTQAGTLSMWTADTYLAALRVGDEIGGLMNDIELQSRCYKARQRVVENVVSQLWNGNAFHARFDPANPVQSRGMPLFPGTFIERLNGWQTHFHSNKMNVGLKPVALMLEQQDSVFSQKIRWINAGLIADYGYGHPLHEAMPFNGMPSMSAWNWWNRLTGVGLDMARKSIIVGPKFTTDNDEWTYPLLSPVVDGTVHASRSLRSGIVECEIVLEQQWGERNIELNEISFLPRGDQDPNDFILYVMHEGEVLSGQDFVREGLRVFRFAEPVKFSRDDRVVVTAAPTESGKVFADVSSGRIVNMGANCTIDPVRTSPDHLSFRLINLQQENQLVRLDAGGSNAGKFTVLLNGNPLGSAGGEMSAVPLFLRRSPVAAEDYAWLQYARSGFVDAVQHIEAIHLPSLQKRLWDLQEEVETAFLADADLRGFQVDIVSPEADVEIDPDDFAYNPRRVMDDIHDAREALDDFLNDLPTLARDPVLAAEITGFFVPVYMQPDIRGAGLNQEMFTVAVDVENPAELEARARLSIVIPNGWRYETKGVIEKELDAATDGFNARFIVNPNARLQEQRYGIRLVLSGAWKNHAYRRYADLAVGHNFIKNWMVAGPFDNNGGQGFEKRYQLELNIETNETYKDGERDIVWKEMIYPDGYVDFNVTFDPKNDVVGYGYVAVHSPREMKVFALIGADEGVKVFHNYKEIYSKYRTSSSKPGTERVPLNLFQGWNHILVKVQDHQGPWGFFMEITDLQGRPVPELRYALDRSP